MIRILRMGLFPAFSLFWPGAMDVTSFLESAVPAGEISRGGPGSWAGVAGEQRDECLRVGASPAGDRVPAGSGLVAGDGLAGERHAVGAGGYVVECLVVVVAVADLVEGGVDEAEVPSGVLVG